jgi:hypothetical protein
MEKIVFSYFTRDFLLAKRRQPSLIYSLLQLNKKLDVTDIRES